MPAPRLGYERTRAAHAGQLWSSAQRMPWERGPVFVGHLRVLVDFDLSDLEIVKGFTPRSQVNHPHMQDAWIAEAHVESIFTEGGMTIHEGNCLSNYTPYAGFVEFGHHTVSGSWVPPQWFAQRAADVLARKYAAKVGKYIEAHVDSIFTEDEMTIHLKVGM